MGCRQGRLLPQGNATAAGLYLQAAVAVIGGLLWAVLAVISIILLHGGSRQQRAGGGQTEYQHKLQEDKANQLAHQNINPFRVSGGR